MSRRWKSAAIVIVGIVSDQFLKALYRPESAFKNTELLGTDTHHVIALAVTCVALGALGWLWWHTTTQSTLLTVGLSLALAGGTSNVVDRVLRGGIIDPLTVGSLRFNLADGLLAVGTTMVLIELITRSTQQEKKGL